MSSLRKTKVWMIASGDDLLHWTSAWTRRQCMDSFVRASESSWRTCQKHGYECVEVEIREVRRIVPVKTEA